MTAGVEERVRAHFHDADARAVPLAAPDPRPVVARARRRRRRPALPAAWRPRRRLLAAVGLAAAAALAAVALVVAVPRHGRVDIDQPPASRPAPPPTPATVPPPTAAPATAVASPPTTGGAPVVPGAAPVTLAELRRVDIPFSAGVDALPDPCRAYWRTGSPAADGFALADNSIDIGLVERDSPDADHDGVPDSLALADVDGDGLADGIALFACQTRGVLPPSGVLVLLARDRSVVTDVEAEVTGAARSRFGDPRYSFRAPVGGATGTVTADVDGWDPTSPNCCASHIAAGTFVLRGGALHLKGFVERDV